jgi:hypothetical protein
MEFGVIVFQTINSFDERVEFSRGKYEKILICHLLKRNKQDAHFLWLSKYLLKSSSKVSIKDILSATYE